MKQKPQTQNRQQQQPKRDGYQRLLNRNAKRAALKRAQEHCPPMFDPMSRIERLTDYLANAEKMSPEQAREAAKRIVAGGGQAASSQPALPPLDERRLSNSDRRKWWEVNGRDVSLLVDSFSNEPPAAERISVEPYIAALQEEKKQ